MGRLLSFIRDVFKGVVDKRLIECAVEDVVEILIDLGIEEDKIKHIIASKYDLKYSEIGEIISKMR